MAPRFEKLTPMLNVAEVAASIAWYVSIGFEVIDTYESEGQIQWAFLRRDGAGLMINQRDLPPGATSGVNLYIDVDDVDALWADLSARVKVYEPLADQFYGMRDFWIEDPDGTILGFGEPVESPEA